MCGMAIFKHAHFQIRPFQTRAKEHSKRLPGIPVTRRDVIVFRSKRQSSGAHRMLDRFRRPKEASGVAARQARRDGSRDRWTG